jgi:hypothetical protein
VAVRFRPWAEVAQQLSAILGAKVPEKGDRVEFFQNFRSHAVVVPNLAKFALGMMIIVGVPPCAGG